MNPVAQAVSEALLQFVWQGCLVVLLVSAVVWALRKSSPNARYLVYCVGMAILAGLPVVTALALYDPLAATHLGPAPLTLTIRGVWSGSSSGLVRMVQLALAMAQPWALGSWMLGVVFFSLRLGWVGARVSALRRSAVPAAGEVARMAKELAQRMGMQRAIRVLVSSLPEGPGVAGWFRPFIVLPAATLLQLSPQQLEAILAHEMAHLRRYDDVVNLVQSVVETLLFYHPAVWWISGRMRHERELCCDDAAVRICGDALCYARALTMLERTRLMTPAVSMGALGNGGSLLAYRIRRVVGMQREGLRPSALPGLLALGMALAGVAIYSNPANGFSVAAPARVEYPEEARVQGIQGTVPVQVEVDGLGAVSGARAMGGPRELRAAAVESAAALRFAPESLPATRRVDIAFELALPAAPAVPVQVAVRTGPAWKDRGEFLVGSAAMVEKDPSRQLELVKQWEALYPETEFRRQRTFLTSQALLGVVKMAAERADGSAVDAGRMASQELLSHMNEYFDDALKPEGMSVEQWNQERRASELTVHIVLAQLAQVARDDSTAEAELKKALVVDPNDAGLCYKLGETIIREIAAANDLTRYSEAIYELARSLAITGPASLPPELQAEAESELLDNYGNYHGSTDGLPELLARVGESALPPPDFHIPSAVEVRWSLTVVAGRDAETVKEVVKALPGHGRRKRVVARSFRALGRFFRRLA